MSLVELKIEQGIHRVILKGDVTLVEASTVKKMLTQWLESPNKPKGLILDLTNALHVQSPALGRLIGLRKYGLRIVLVLPERHTDLFAALGVSSLFEVHPSVAKAKSTF